MFRLTRIFLRKKMCSKFVKKLYCTYKITMEISCVAWSVPARITNLIIGDASDLRKVLLDIWFLAIYPVETLYWNKVNNTWKLFIITLIYFFKCITGYLVIVRNSGPDIRYLSYVLYYISKKNISMIKKSFQISVSL